jgi:hypothetical protein
MIVSWAKKYHHCLTLLNNRYSYGKCGSPTHFTIDRYFALMSLDNFIGNAQSQAGALPRVFRRKKWFEYFNKILPRYSDAIVGNFHPDKTVFAPGLNLDDPLVRDRVDGINQKIHEYLIDLPGITFCQGQIAVILFQRGFIF